MIIDVSHHQGIINWKEVATPKTGVKGAYFKVTEGASFVDSRKSRNAQGCIENGLPFGGYHYVRLDKLPATNVDHFLRNLPVGWTFPPMWDLETIGNEAALRRGRGFTTDHTLTCLERLEQALGVTPLIYTFATFPNTYLERTTGNAKKLSTFPLWVAHYTKATSPAVPAPWDKWQMWQYTSDGEISGINGRVDLNRGWPISGGTPQPSPQPPDQGDIEMLDPTTQILVTMSALNIVATREGMNYWYGRYTDKNDLNFDPGKLFRTMAELDNNPNT